MNEKMRDFYRRAYPSDGIWEYMDDQADFKGLFECLDRYGDVYDYIGVGDSVVRERLFERLASLMEVEYDYIYDQWLRAAM